MTQLNKIIRVLVADDHVIFRHSLRTILEKENHIAILGEASNGDECIGMLNKFKPDVLLLDLRTPPRGGLAILEELNFNTLPTRTIVLTTTEEDDDDVVRAMRLGARGVMLKKFALDLLAKSIHKVHTGEIWLDNRMTSEVLQAFTTRNGSHSAKLLLSNREKEVVLLVAQGYRNKEIGGKLLISEQTVKNHLHNVFEKLGVSDRLELALYAIHHHLVQHELSTSR
jgi:DNA-binding NarL/FixJ family response regulator